ncbi:MAG: hypothetical protein WAK56_10170 [Candidatus Sulfotelmatobacter sp.]
MAFAEFLLTVLKQLREGPVDVAEAEKTEVVGLDEDPSGVKARLIFGRLRGAEAPLFHRYTGRSQC